MGLVTATGKLNGKTITVIVTKEKKKITITFDGLEYNCFEYIILKSRLMDMIRHFGPVGGTYYMKPTDLFAYHEVLAKSFFDELIEIKTKGRLGNIPFSKKPNIVY